MKIDVKWGFPKKIEVLGVTSNTNEDPFRGQNLELKVSKK
jgi:hypothetical protein